MLSGKKQKSSEPHDPPASVTKYANLTARTRTLKERIRTRMFLRRLVFIAGSSMMTYFAESRKK